MSTIMQQSAKLISPAKIEYYPEAASQSFKKGEFVYLVSGKVTVITASSRIAGMALQDASTTTDTAIAVAIAEEGVLFEANVTGAVTAITNVGVTYGISISSNKHYVDLSVTTLGLARLKIKAISPRDAVGDTYGRVLVEVLGSMCQLSGQTS